MVIILAASLYAREYSPRVVSPHRADVYSMKTFARFDRWSQLAGDQRAWEVYKYLVDTHTGLFHVNAVYEGEDALSEFTIVRDPVKAVNVYGYAFCGALGPIMEGIWEDAGFGKARTISLPAWRHATCEVFYENAWHYLDLDVRAAFRRDDGSLASLTEARTDPTLWKNRGPVFFPNDPLDSTQKVYRTTQVHFYHRFHQSGHTMDYVLRQGETFTRWWKPRGGRWHHCRQYNKIAWLRRLIEKPPRGPKPNHPHFTVHTYGNGRFTYEPNLTDSSSDFLDGALCFENVHPAKKGLALKKADSGFAIFSVRTPYIIVPVVGDLDTTYDDRDASLVTLEGANVTLSLSLDNGLSWRDLKRMTESPQTWDLTGRVAGTYGYLLKTAFAGKPGEALIRRLKITTWVQVAPASLPALKQGINRMDYRTGDDFGLKTRAIRIHSNASDPKQLLKYTTDPPEDYDPARRTSRIRGTATLKVADPTGMKIAWVSAGASFNTYQQAASKNTKNTISYKTGAGEPFKEIYRAAVPAYTQHWHYHAASCLRLEQPADAVFLRFRGKPAVNTFNIYAHCLDTSRESDSPVVITHTWHEGATRYKRAVKLSRPGSYTIDVKTPPSNESITIAVPSDTKGE